MEPLLESQDNTLEVTSTTVASPPRKKLKFVIKKPKATPKVVVPPTDPVTVVQESSSVPVAVITAAVLPKIKKTVKVSGGANGVVDKVD